jgi:MFS-type transporter involved in bile tolerance (Atg22 family)
MASRIAALTAAELIVREIARALADQHRGNPLGPHELAGRSGLLQFALFAGASLIPASASSRSRTARTFSHES